MVGEKTYFLWIGLVFLLIVSLIAFTSVQLGQNRSSTAQSHLKGTIGHTMFNYRSHLNAIADERTLSDQNLNQAHDRLLACHAYAETLDFALRPVLPMLVPATESMLQIVDYLERQRNADPLNWTEKHTQTYTKLLDFIQAMNDPLSRVYYEPDSHEGTGISLTLHNTDEMKTYNDALRSYVSSLN
ncbi:hypothetical protein [Paenibacillus humicus]|uniref:hypothetical protein n=1 Tax=Paenibacillus humicus TaxID=412861 RepID=UPI000FD9BB83|nr:hypothetical protein [Paenibacillus humicus]